MRKTKYLSVEFTLKTVMTIIAISGCAAILSSPRSKAAPTGRLNVVVWDQYFDPSGPAWPKEDGLGTLGGIFAWDPTYSNPASGMHKISMHGLEVAYIMAKGLPDVTVYRAHDAFIPWQDPAVCALASDEAFDRELAIHGYPKLPNCRADAEKGIQAFGAFLAQNQIKLVNMSHGTYYDEYVLHNPILLHKLYPKADYAVIQKFLYLNFMALGDVYEAVFRDNPNVLFVVAAGNNADEVDHDVVRQWREPGDENLTGVPVVHVPTYFGSFSARYDNVIAVASSYDGKQLAGDSNYSPTSVDFAKWVGSFVVPDLNGKTSLFNGTSAAAAETSRLMEEAYLAYGGKLKLTPAFMKKLSQEVAARNQVPGLAGKLVEDGILLDDAFLAELARQK